ncbi:uncharacterized protein N7479_000056 [Penicillium vulpinum]|uniref:Alpha 1,4-glycosyltransferase domain-containing protein n=1 Tax=Penicillium vulpinum TaxID=29845 RepID=A0A1V6RXJ7_9EURO|nr:uncharacterized protein N7479_000056 [Penicillium vulpinum]KAJ5970138.1 hypothetical protein N7479_000056 [Penicillium vulpinum]OQE06209.1 hypothetical protein PENVUL_c019G02010 [Penicillium vulpinum]
MRNRLFLGSPNRHKYVLVGAILTLFILFKSLPPPVSRLDPRTEKLYGESQPRYLHQSTFRTSPDYEYEVKLSNALRAIEIERQMRYDEDATDTLWQIMLPGVNHRSDDSIQFETKNSEWKYKLVQTDWADKFILETLQSIPEIARLYKSYPHSVHRGDLLRYLILWYYGGYYADLDVYPARSIKHCPSLRDSVFKDNTVNTNISLVVGIEIDEPFASPQKMRDWHWARRYGFIQYTMYAPRRFSPLLREIIVRVLAHTKRRVYESHFWSGGYSEMDTLEITGPGVFTDAILDVLSDTLPPTHRLVQQSADADAGFSPSGSSVQRVTWAPFHGIQEPLCVEGPEAKSDKLLGGLCVLPVNAWGNGQRHSGSENFNSQQACINHRFGGTWKPWKQSWQKYLFG